MQTSYLHRIGLTVIPAPTLEGLNKLHKAHLFNIPFEDLDIHRKVPLNLNLEYLQDKVIHRGRGGFCYELNSLFSSLLQSLGFDVQMISASVFNENKQLGPELDHLALIIRIDGIRWLADVGFGDLFIKPLKIDETGIQVDMFHSFKIKQLKEDSFVLSMSTDDGAFENKYVFNTAPRNIEEFEPQCHFKQSSPDSHFVKTKICTLATEDGRKTLLNDKFMHKSKGQRRDEMIKDELHEARILMEHFHIAPQESSYV